VSKLEALFERAQETKPLDRSGETYRLAMQGLEDGDDDQTIISSVSADLGSVEKYGSRLAAEVMRILDKERPRHPHIGRTCAQASCGPIRIASNPVLVSPVEWTQLWAGKDEPPEYVLEPFLPAGRTTTVVSPPKLGKSLLGLEIAAAVATGKAMWDREVQQRCVMYLDQEMGEADLRERLRDMGYGPDDDLSRLYYYLHQPWPLLDTEAGGRTLLNAVQACGAEVLVIDTQSKVLEGDENDAGTMTRFFRYTLAPLKAKGSTVLLFDHVGRDAGKGPRGSSQKPADVDAVWHLGSRSETGLTLKRTHNRTRHGEDVLYLERSIEPLRHELVTTQARTEEIIEAIRRKMDSLDLSLDLTGREALEAVRKQGTKARDENIREAYKRYKADWG